MQTDFDNICLQILEVLKEHPGIKARDIATNLEIDKKLINRALYGNIKDKCVQDEKYCWYLNKDVPTLDQNIKISISKKPNHPNVP